MHPQVAGRLPREGARGARPQDPQGQGDLPRDRRWGKGAHPEAPRAEAPDGCILRGADPRAGREALGEISKSSLSRFIRASGFDRATRLHVATKDQVQGFSYEYPLECVQVDDMHSFYVPDHTGKLRKAILIAFLDDATRRVLYAHFSFSENALEFERGILHILRSHGRPHRIYTDNGSTFVSDQTQRIMDTLGIPLIHSRPGMPKGRGKIERFFRTVRTQFEITLDPASIRSIQDYDMRFRSWLESEYHRQPHSGLGGRTPLDAYLAGTDHIFRVDPSIDLDEVFCHEDSRVVANDGTV